MVNVYISPYDYGVEESTNKYIVAVEGKKGVKMGNKWGIVDMFGREVDDDTAKRILEQEEEDRGRDFFDCDSEY